MKKYRVRLIILAAVIAGILAIYFFTPVREYLSADALQQYKELIRGFVERNYLIAVLVFIVAYIALTALSIPGAMWVSIGGGFFFGVVFATIYINIGATVGATIVFLAARFLLGEMVQNKYGDKLAKFNKEFEANGWNYLIILRLIPVFPFWMINLFAGVTKAKLRTFVWTTSLGIIPGSAVYAYLGYAINDIGEEGVPTNIIFAFLALAVLSAVPLVVKKIRGRKSVKAAAIGEGEAPSNAPAAQ